MIGSIRRECLDHVIVLDEWHLKQIGDGHHSKGRECRARGKTVDKPVRFMSKYSQPFYQVNPTSNTGGGRALCSAKSRVRPVPKLGPF